MENRDEQVTYFAETDFRNQRTRFGIRNKDRLRHVYVIGKTGVGKSTLLENMAIQDVVSGNGIAFIDPHGTTAEEILRYVPPHRMKDVIYFAPFDTEHPIGFNVMEESDPAKYHLIASGLLSVFKKIWVDAWSGRMEYILMNTILALLETPNTTLLGINRMLLDDGYREYIVENIQDASVKDFWVNDYAKWDDRYRREAGAAIQNKIGQFTSNPLIRNIVGQPRSSFDFRSAMDQEKIVIINLSKGRLGETNSRLLGGMITTRIYLAAMSRAEYSKQQLEMLPAFYLFVDEFQNFASESFADILSEARKYKLSLTMAHQYIAQMPEEVRDAIFGNVGTMITFRVGETDAEIFAKEFAPTFEQEDFASLGFAQIYLKLLIKGIASRPFSARTVLPDATKYEQALEHALAHTRQTYTRPRTDVEAAIAKWYEPMLTKKEKEKKKEMSDFIARKKAEVEARGEVWYDNPEEYERAQKQKKDRQHTPKQSSSKKSAPVATQKKAPSAKIPYRASTPRKSSQPPTSPAPKKEDAPQHIEGDLGQLLDKLGGDTAQPNKTPDAILPKATPEKTTAPQKKKSTPSKEASTANKTLLQEALSRAQQMKQKETSPNTTGAKPPTSSSSHEVPEAKLREILSR